MPVSFSTVEEMELLDVIVVKATGTGKFMRDKLEGGIKMALTKRPYTRDSFHRLIHSIERDIQKRNPRKFPARNSVKLLSNIYAVSIKWPISDLPASTVILGMSTFEKELKLSTK